MDSGPGLLRLTSFLFQNQDFDGIGEQILWLTEECEQTEQWRNDIDGGQQLSVRRTSMTVSN